MLHQIIKGSQSAVIVCIGNIIDSLANERPVSKEQFSAEEEKLSDDHHFINKTQTSHQQAI